MMPQASLIPIHQIRKEKTVTELTELNELFFTDEISFLPSPKRLRAGRRANSRNSVTKKDAATGIT